MVQIDMEMPKECQQCILHENERTNDYGWYCDCRLTGTEINLLYHKRPKNCPIKELNTQD